MTEQINISFKSRHLLLDPSNRKRLNSIKISFFFFPFLLFIYFFLKPSSHFVSHLSRFLYNCVSNTAVCYLYLEQSEDHFFQA